MDKMLVKPMNTEELLLQIESLLVGHEEKKQKTSPRRNPRLKEAGRVPQKWPGRDSE